MESSSLNKCNEVLEEKSKELVHMMDDDSVSSDDEAETVGGGTTIEDSADTPSEYDDGESAGEDAGVLKERGNEHFKAGRLSEAREAYEQALRQARHDPALRTLVQGNLCMLALRREDWAGAVRHAEEVLQADPLNLKALYRKGVAHLRLADPEQARFSLSQCVELDPGNAAAKKDLQEATAALKRQRAAEKAVYSGFFQKSAIYDDREQERATRARKEEEQRETERDDWTKSKLERRSRGLPEQSLEEYREDRAKQREVEAAAAASATTSTATQHTQAQTQDLDNKAKSAAAAALSEKFESDDDDSDVEYDEEEQRILRETKSKGYCYFRNQQSDAVKSLIGDITPKSIGADTVLTSSARTTITAGGGGGSEDKNAIGAVGVSDWNHAGTWEERDVTARVKELLVARVAGVTADRGEEWSVAVESAEATEGEAHAVLTRGKKKLHFDFALKLRLRVKLADQDKGHRVDVVFPEVSPDSAFEYTRKSTKPLPEGASAALLAFRAALEADIKTAFIQQISSC